MKIAFEASHALLRPVSVLGLLLTVSTGVAPFSAYASEPPTLMPPPAAASSGSATTNENIVSPVMASSSNEDHAKSLTPLEDKVSDSIKDTIKQFASVDNVTLEDLNTARQAIAKLDVLIDIEKHMAELDRVRADRNKSKNLTTAIPVSALNMPPAWTPPATQVATTPAFAPPPFTPMERNEVNRILGADGHYAAVIQEKTFHVGDKLPDGSLIISISMKSVETKSRDGAISQLKVKGVDQVYGHTL